MITGDERVVGYLTQTTSRAARSGRMHDNPPNIPGVSPDEETLDGVLERITYLNEENGYTVAKLKVPRQKKPVTVAGHLPAVSVGEGLRVAGKWVNHAQYGRQFLVTHFQSA